MGSGRKQTLNMCTKPSRRIRKIIHCNKLSMNEDKSWKLKRQARWNKNAVIRTLRRDERAEMRMGSRAACTGKEKR